MSYDPWYLDRIRQYERAAFFEGWVWGFLIGLFIGGLVTAILFQTRVIALNG